MGAGTGKATVLFAARGIAVHALEPLAEMAAVAQDNCVAYPDVTIDRSDGFEQPEVRSYEFVVAYSTTRYVELLQTHSDHIVLEPGQRRALLDGVASVIDGAGGVLELQYVTRLCLARAG